MGVPQETPPPREVLSAAPLVPVSAEDFARARRRIVFRWMGAGLLAIVVGFGIYEKSRSSQDGRAALDDGEKMLKAGRYAEAIQSLDRALAVDRGMVSAYLFRGRAKAALGQTESAVADFAKVIQLQPGGTDAFVERAAIHLQTLDYPGVVADCGEAIRRNPRLTYAFTLRGMAFREMGDLPGALEDFNHAVELAPGLDTYFQRASTYQSMGDHPKALADLDQVVALYPTSPMGYLSRAKSREATGNLAGARSDRETGRRLENRHPGQ